jgi:hypothetical protein
MDLLRHTAATWVILKTEPAGFFKYSHFTGNCREVCSDSLDVLKTAFQTTVKNGSHYTSLQAHQMAFLYECISITNEIRTSVGCEAENIENINIGKIIGKHSYEMAVLQRELIAKCESMKDDDPAKTVFFKVVLEMWRQCIEVLETMKYSTQDEEFRKELAECLKSFPVKLGADGKIYPNLKKVVPEPVAEQEDIADIVARLEAQSEGRWVSQDEFSDLDINVKYKTTKTLQRYREKDNVKWSENNPALGMDKAGNFLERSGKDQYNYEYRYFLLRKFDKQPPPPVPHDPSHVPNGN